MCRWHTRGVSDDYLAVNRANWDDRAGIHEHSPGYDRERLLSGEHELSHVVAFDRPRLGDISGLRAVHLQCHIGTDTLSLHRLGARVVGLDLSPSSLAAARRLAADAGADVEYVEADVYSAPSALADHAPFDLVYTGIGALGWLPSIDRWARTVAALLRPGGRLFIREGHPVLWACDDPRPDGLVVLAYPYFETPEPTVWDDASTYVEPAPGSDGGITATVTHEWNHGLGEIFTALTRHGMDVVSLEEHRTVPYLALGDQMVADPELPGEYRLAEGDDRLPLTYTLQAVRRG
ncbi:class I SAM-dependent methyltransferase [Janibacter melonis]